MDDPNWSWYVMIWCGIVWYGMVANDHGMVWYDVAWYGMVWMQTDHGKLPLHPRATQVLRPNPPTHHLTVNQRCRCTPAKNQPQTNDWKMAASAFGFMVGLIWLENLAFGGFSSPLCSWLEWNLGQGGFSLFIWSKWIWNFELATG